MEKKEIEKKLKESKGFNDETISIIINYIDDFEEAGFTKYVSREEVLERICKNLDHDIEYVEFEGNTIGKYLREEKKIRISKRITDEEVINSTIFHEFTHCITYSEDTKQCGFRNKYEIEGEYINSWGHGLNEGITTYIEERRAKIHEIRTASGYIILNQLIENLMMVFDEEKILDCYFNCPDDIDEVLEMDETLCYDFMKAFDDVYQEENRMLEEQNKIESRRLWRIILGQKGKDPEKQNSVYEIAGESMKVINSIFMDAFGEVDSIDRFDAFLQFIKRIEKQETGIDKNSVYGKVIENIKHLNKDKGYKKEEILEVLEKNKAKEDVNTQMFVETLMKKDKNEIITYLYKTKKGRNKIILNDSSYCKLFEDFLFEGRKVISIEEVVNLGELITANPDIDFDELSLSKYEVNCRKVITARTLDERVFACCMGKSQEIKENKAKIENGKVELNFDEKGKIKFAKEVGTENHILVTEEVGRKSNIEYLEKK